MKGNGKIFGCYAGSVMLAALAVYQFIELNTVRGSVMLLLSTIFAWDGASTQIVLRKPMADLERAQSRLSLLAAELAEHEGVVNQLTDGLDVGIFICDPKANVLFANQCAQQMFQSENPIGRPLIAVTLSDEFERLVLEACTEARPQSRKISFTHPEGHVAHAKAWPQSDGKRIFASVYETQRHRPVAKNYSPANQS